MWSIEQQIPLFPSSFVEENRAAIDFNNNNVIAFACGTTINFSYVEDFTLKQGYSITLGRNNVSALKFHPTLPYVFIGDSKGFIYLYDYQIRQLIAKPFLFNDNVDINQFGFFDDRLLVLYKDRLFALFVFQQAKEKPKFYNFQLLAKEQLPEQTTNFCCDPFHKNRFFIYGKDTTFFMLYSFDKAKVCFKPITEQFFLPQNLSFKEAQFSLHLRDYVFFIAEQCVMLYNIEFNLISSIQHYQKTSSFLQSFVQFSSDHSKILCFHKSGTITMYDVRDPFNLYAIAEIPHTLQDQQLFAHCSCPVRDDFLACLYSPLGLTLFDLSSFKMMSILPYWTDKTSHFVSNENYYAIGTQNGYVIYGNLFTPNDKAVFKISNKPITFLTIVPSKSSIYWATDGDLGIIDAGFRRVIQFPEHCLSTQRVVGSPHGAVMVQREACVLGIFIDGAEICTPTSSPILDFCFNDDSSPTAGSVMFIIESGSILFLNYSKQHRVCQPYLKRSFDNSLYFISCCAWKSSNVAIGAKDGSVILLHTDTLESQRIEVRMSSIKKLQFSGKSLFGICEDGYLFKIRDLKVTQFNRAVRDFFIVNEMWIAIISSDYSVQFLKTSDFENLSAVSKALPLPTLVDFIKHFLITNPVLNNTGYIISNTKKEKIENEKPVHSVFDGSNDSLLTFTEPVTVGQAQSYTNSIEFHNDESNQNEDNENDEETNDEINIDINQANGQPQKSKTNDLYTPKKKTIRKRNLSNADENCDLDEIDGAINNSRSTLLQLDGISSTPIMPNPNVHNLIAHPNDKEKYGAIAPEVFMKNSPKPSDRLLPFISREGRDFWLHLLNKPSLRLMGICACGDSLQYESTIADVVSLLDYTPKLMHIMFDAFLFANRIKEADKVLSREQPSSPTFMIDSVMATAMITFDEEMSAEQHAVIKSSGISLIMNKRYKEGSHLLKIAKLDSVAASYLIESGHPLEAMRFVRSSLSGEEKKKACFNIALQYFQRGRFYEAMLLFLTSGEYHPALYCLLKLHRVDDAYIIKAYLIKKRLLFEHKGTNLMKLQKILPLKRLIQTIDAQFATLLERRGIDINQFKLCIKPKMFSTP